MLIFSARTSSRQWRHQLPSKKRGGAHQNTRRHMPEELLVSTIKTTSAQALSLKCQPSIF